MGLHTLRDLSDGSAFDVIVLGAGAAGLAAATFAAIDGHSVLLVERTAYVGGTSALSAATVWVPNTLHAPKISDGDSVENARSFLDAVVGNRSSAAMRDAFLASGPTAIARLEAETDVHFRPYATHPDYEQDATGATLRGRAMEPLPFDGRALGAALNVIRPPIPEFTVLGGMMVDRTDINHLLAMTKSFKSLAHAARILARYGIDRATASRGTRLVMGNALIGRFLKTLLSRGVPIVTCCETVALDAAKGEVKGVTLAADNQTRKIMARRGVVLAGGGFGRNADRRRQMMPEPTPHYSPAAPGHTGALQDLAFALGARFGTGNLDNAFWAPVSVRQRADGSTAVFPHFVLDRSKPGTVCVDQSGKRFTNESASYHLFARAMFEADKSAPTIPCFIITDAVGLKTYGLGMVRMGTRNLAPYLADGYLTEAASIAQLARKLGMDETILAATIAAMNTYARTGIDPEFGRGSTAYHRVNGDANRQPNPTLGPIDTAPFYAVRLYPGDIGAATGLVIDENARVLKSDGQPIAHLYACGNEANSIMGGVYPGPGITLGPAITFAYRAVTHAIHGTVA